MTQSKQSKRKSRFWHWVRVTVMFLSFGMIFPNAMSEDEDRDIAKYDAHKDTKVKQE